MKRKKKQFIIGILGMFLLTGLSELSVTGLFIGASAYSVARINNIKDKNIVNKKIYNIPPHIDSIECPDINIIGLPCYLEIRARDDGPRIKYVIDWGDTHWETTPWIFANEHSGDTYSFTLGSQFHMYTKAGNYIISVFAVDKYGAESNTKSASVSAPKIVKVSNTKYETTTQNIDVSMPKINLYNPSMQLFTKLLERFPFFSKILNQILL
jgi:hypothetical protein